MTAENAFAAAHSQRLLFTTDAWRDALARLDAGLGTREPFLLVTGEAGTGKTALVLEAAAAWGERATVAFVTNPALTRMEFLEEIARRFGAEPPANPSKPQLLACLEQTLANVGADKVAVLVVEEAHELDSDLLDELRLVVNSAAQAKRPFEAVLVGLPALDVRLEQAQASLRQRVAVHCRLNPLSRKETRRYLHHRVAASDGDGPALFPRQTCNEIFDRTYGVPRAINSLAAEAIRVATAEGQSAVTAEHVQVAATRINLDVPARASARAAEAEAQGASSSAQTSQPGPKPAEPAVASAAAGSSAGVTPKGVTPQTAAAAASPAAAAAPAAGKGAATQKSPAGNSGTTKSQPPPPPKSASPASPASPGSPKTSPTPGVAAAPKTAAAPAVVATAEPSAGPDTDTLADPDAALAVTTALSVDMDPDDPRAKDWISRFVGSQGPPRIGSALGGPFPDEAYGDFESEAEEAPEPAKAGGGKRGPKSRPRKLIRVVEDEFPSASGAVFESPVGARPTGIPRPSQDHRNGSRMGGPMFALGVVVVVAVGWIVLLKGGELSLPGDTSMGSTRVGAADSADAASPTDEGGRRPLGGSAAMRSASTPDDQVSTLDPEAPESASVATENGPPKRMVIEVGTYIDAERARFERDQLIAETGLRVWVTRVAEYGSESYRVIVGTFPNEERAEASASYMLERGLVSEARVVELQPRKGRR